PKRAGSSPVHKAIVVPARQILGDIPNRLSDGPRRCLWAAVRADLNNRLIQNIRLREPWAAADALHFDQRPSGVIRNRRVNAILYQRRDLGMSTEASRHQLFGVRSLSHQPPPVSSNLIPTDSTPVRNGA